MNHYVNCCGVYVKQGSRPQGVTYDKQAVGLNLGNKTQIYYRRTILIAIYETLRDIQGHLELSKFNFSFVLLVLRRDLFATAKFMYMQLFDTGLWYSWTLYDDAQ